MTSLNVAEAKAKLSELLGRVAHGGETILITRRGRPMAKLAPIEPRETRQLADVEGWLEDEDPFFSSMDSIVTDRSRRNPRVLSSTRPSDDEER